MPPTSEDNMPTKTKTITVKGPYDRLVGQTSKTEIAYRVERVTDSILYAPDQWLPRAEVETLCMAPDWKVTVISIGR
jgi:hypothetical protein